MLLSMIISLPFLVLFGCAKEKPITVKIGYQPTEIYRHFFVAIDKGLFMEEGLDIEPVQFASANLMAEALIAGRIDGTATSAFPVIFSIEQNSPHQFKIYLVNAITENEYPDYILVKRDSNIAQLSDLKGKKIGTYPGSTILSYTKIILGHFMDPTKDITIIQLNPGIQLQALESEQVDALFTLEPNASIGMSRGIARVLEEAPLAKYVMNPLPGSSSTFSSKFVREHPKEAEKVKNAMFKAIDFIRDKRNIDEVKISIAKWTPIELEIIDRLGPLKYWKLNEIDRKAVQRLADLLYEKEVLENKVDTSNLYYR